MSTRPTDCASRLRTGQVGPSAAEIFEESFVPALSKPWVGRVAAAAGMGPGQTVLDVACGTGALAREALKRVKPGGSVAGVDRDEEMLAVARGVALEIDWRLGVAEALPFDDDHFDAVVSQFGLMFFDDRITGLREMLRVLRPGGRLAVAVWGALERTPGYADFTALLERVFGDWASSELKGPFALGDPDVLSSLFAEAGIAGATVNTLHGMARFPSISSWVRTDLKGWVLSGTITEEQYEAFEREAESELRHHAISDGSVEFAAPAHVVTASKP